MVARPCDSVKNFWYVALFRMTERWSLVRWRRPAHRPGWLFCQSRGVRPSKFSTLNLTLPARMRWTPDGRAVTYIGRQDGQADIWSQPIDGGEPKRITNFKADDIFSFDWSRDNKLAISHGTSESDVVLIRNAK